MCLAFDKNFSRKISLFPKAFFARFLVFSIRFCNSSKSFATCIPMPPPPTLALIKIGYPMSLHLDSKLSSLISLLVRPGQIGRLLLIANSLALSLFPIERIVSGFGPIQIIPTSITLCANSAFSERKP